MTENNKPTVVLVHGAFADASSYARVIPELLADGLNVVVPAVPNRSLIGDSAYIASVVRQIPGPVVLVGHSYGGAVITVAGVEGNVKGLVYLAGYALKEGESLGELQGRFPESDLAAALVYTTFPLDDTGDEGTDVSVEPARLPQIFAADVEPELTRVLAVSQRPLAAQARPELLGESSQVQERVARTVAALLATLAADHATRTLPNGRPATQTLFERITASIEASLGDPDLSPQAIADQHGVSLRYLHQLFQRQGTTVGGWIRNRRLEGARQELARPEASHRAISAVGARWGFTSASHFSRAFRDVHGVSPNQWRAEHSAVPP